jgi:DNA replication protein DnaC
MRTCKTCGGSQILYDRNAASETHGELVLCPCVAKGCTCGGIPPYQVFGPQGEHSWCSCRSARTKLHSAKKAFRESQIPKKYLWKFIEDFEPVNSKASQILGMISAIRDSSTKGFYLWGAAGGGKTLLACIGLQELMLKYGLGGKYVDLSRQFFQRLKNSFDASSENEETAGDILEELIRIPFLVVDDFGVQRNTEWESEMLYNLIDSRYTEERLTIVTSNFHLSKYKEVASGRVHSRLQEMCSVIHVDLPDFRERFARDIPDR